jgi:hypothetical protein
MRGWLRDQSLTLFFTLLFAGALVGQSFAGLHAVNEEAAAHGEAPMSYWHYVVSVQFGVAVLENWQSEYLQFFLFIAATIWLVQRGSNESKRPGRVGLGTDEEQFVGRYAKPESSRWAKVGGLRTWLYSYSLLIVMGLIFVASWFGQSVTGLAVYNEEQRAHDEPTVSWATYVVRPDFWERTLQNWQSEFLAIGTLVVFSVYLRARGSPESKPVGAPHGETGSESG